LLKAVDPWASTARGAGARERNIEICSVDTLHEQSVEVGPEIFPVDRAQVIAGWSLRRIGKFQLGSDLPGAAFGSWAPRKVFGKEEERCELRKGRGVDKQGGGGFKAGKLRGISLSAIVIPCYD